MYFSYLSMLRFIVVTFAVDLGIDCLDDNLIPSGALRDNILFDISWPGSPQEGSFAAKKSQVDPDIPSRVEDEGRNNAELKSNKDVTLMEKISDKLLPEDDHHKPIHVDMKAGNNEAYRCVVPEILSWEESGSDEDGDDEDSTAEKLLQSLQDRCTKLLMGYWTYELCHWKHVRQYHEPMKQAQDKKDEYFLGKFSKSATKKIKSDDKSGAEKDEADEKKSKKEKEIPVWYYNGEEYPYYEVMMSGGTPCDLKDNVPRSIVIRYICDMNSHITGTFLNIEEITTCKYEAVVSTSNLCQNRAYRLKENPVHSIQCYSTNGSPSKPNSLLEHEIYMMSYLQSPKHQKSAKSEVDSDGLDQEEEGEGEGKYRKDIGRTRESARLDENFIRAFLSGDMCLRGGSGWWQHEICYGKHVKQLHEEANKPTQELVLGNWIQEGHRRWFSNAGHRKQSSNHVIHLYMNGDVCDVTGVARQCQVKFRCSKSSRPSQISIFLEEPTTCNYILTMEASFLCPLLQDTDEFGGLRLPKDLEGGATTTGGGGEEESGSGDRRGELNEELELDDDGNVKPAILEPGTEESNREQDTQKSRKKRT